MFAAISAIRGTKTLREHRNDGRDSRSGDRGERSFGGNRGGYGGGNRGGFHGGGHGGHRGGGFNRGPREMHKATCAKCQKECEVPFKPTEGRPVYCKDCFVKPDRY